MTRRTYDTYTGNVICTLDDLKKLKDIYVQMFGVAQNPTSCRSFVQILSTLYHVSSRNNPLLSIATEILPNDKDGFSTIDIRNEFKISQQQIPDVIFQSKNIQRDTVIIKEQADLEKLESEYNNQRENGKCALCGKSLKANNFIYQKNGKYYGRSCFESNVADESSILNTLSMLFFLKEVKKQIIMQSESTVISIDKNNLCKDFGSEKLSFQAYDILANNGYTEKDFSKEELKNVAKLTIEKMFLVNFVSIDKNIKLNDELRKKILNTKSISLKQIFVNKESKGIFYQLLTDINYIKRLSLTGNLTVFFNTYNMVSVLLSNKGEKDLAELKALIPELKHISAENNLKKYIALMAKISPLLDKGMSQAPTKDTRIMPNWFVTNRLNKTIQEYYSYEEFDLGSKKLFICCKK